MGANDKLAATYHGGECAPTTAFYVELNIDLDGNVTQTNGTSFYSWIANVRAEAKAEALNEVADQMRDRFTASWIRGKAREYTHGPHKPVGAFSIPENKEKTP